ncbi:MAG: hypothetical protein R3F34_13560 [Planctomycetota bacterium]
MSRVSIVVAAILVAIGIASGAGKHSSASDGPRLFGPVARLVAALRWVEVREAFDRGEPARAFAVAETALAIDPGATEGWCLLVERQLLTDASSLREPDGARRRAWIESALDTAERGVRSARDPGRVEFTAALGLLVQATDESPPPWPTGVAGLRNDARRWFERALEHGVGAAREFLVDTDEEAPGSVQDRDS